MTPEAATGSPPLLEVRGIVKQFPGVKALRGVNLTLGRGEVLAVVGENGAGKSTLVLALLGLRWLGKRYGDPFTLEGVPRGARRARSTLAEAEHQAEDASDADATEDERRARRR